MIIYLIFKIIQTLIFEIYKFSTYVPAQRLYFQKLRYHYLVDIGKISKQYKKSK